MYLCTHTCTSMYVIKTFTFKDFSCSCNSGLTYCHHAEAAKSKGAKPIQQLRHIRTCNGIINMRLLTHD